MDNPAQLREKVQEAIVEVITNGLQAGTMQEERAKEIAKFALDMLPENIPFNQLIETIPKLDDKYPELASVVVPIISAYEAKVRQTIDVQISKLIKEGRLDEALSLTQKAISYEQKLN